MTNIWTHQLLKIDQDEDQVQMSTINNFLNQLKEAIRIFQEVNHNPQHPDKYWTQIKSC